MTRLNPAPSRRDLVRFGAGAALVTGLVPLAGCQQIEAMSPGRSGSAEATSTGSANAFESLTSDHRRVEALLTQLGQTPSSGAAERDRLFQQVKTELTRHALAEENVLYAAYLYSPAGSQERARSLYEDHAEVKAILFRLDQMPKGDPAWINELNRLRAELADHIRVEETYVFPQMRSALSQQQIDLISRRVAREKQLVG